LAVFGMLGVVSPGGSTAWREPGAIIVEKETGSRFLLVDGVLRPVLNLASARLLAGAEAPVRSVSGKSLAGVPHGAAVGIPGAPTPTDALLRLGDPASAAAYPGGRVRAIPVGAAAVAAAPQSPADSVTAGYPPEPPRLADGQGGQRVPCVRAVFRSVTAVEL